MGLFRFKHFLSEQEQNDPPFNPISGDETRLHHAFNLIKLANDLYDKSDGSGDNVRMDFLHSARSNLEHAINAHMDHHEALYNHPSLPSPYHSRVMSDHNNLIHGLVGLHTSLGEQIKSPLMPPLETILHRDRDTGSYYVHQHNIATTRQINNLMDSMWRTHTDILRPASREIIEIRNNRNGFYRALSEHERKQVRDSSFRSSMDLGRFMRDHNRDDFDELPEPETPYQ